MCGRIIVSKTYEEVKSYIAEHYNNTQFTCALNLPAYNIAPAQKIITLKYENSLYQASLQNWGIKLDYLKKMLINIRAESIITKPYFQNLFISGRCLILVDGFYEWREEDNSKQPYRFYFADNNLFALAGVWLKNPLDKTSSCGIITTNANSLMQSIHHRMPLILSLEESKSYLHQTNINELYSFLRTKEANQLQYHSVSPKVNSALFNTKECIQPYR